MQGRAFLAVARELAAGITEAHWRTSVIQAYYALMLESRDALRCWGRPLPPHQNVHSYVRLQLLYAGDPDLKSIGMELDDLIRQRNTGSYDLSFQSIFASAATAQGIVQDVDALLALLDAIEADPVRRAAAIASLPP